MADPTTTTNLGRGVSLSASDVTVSFGDQVVLDNVSFELAPGSSAAIIGPNGSGKTTLLNALTGLVRPDRGSITADPANAAAYVLQHRNTRTWLPLTAREVITMGRFGHRRLLSRLTGSDRRLIVEAAARLEVDDLLDESFGELSGGQQQRVLLAQALVQEPQLLLLDEPITGLDLASQQRILDLIGEETAAGTTVVITTHNLDEARHCDSVLLLAGHLVAHGSPNDVLVPDRLREAFGSRVLGDHRGHDHDGELLVVDDHGHGH